MNLFLFKYNREQQYALEFLTIIDVYESLIWTERFKEPGDFELKMPISGKVGNNITTAYEMCVHINDYIYILVKDIYDPSDSTHQYYGYYDTDNAMIVESYESSYETAGDAYVTFKGRSLLSLFERRVVFQYKTFNNTYLVRNFQEIMATSCGTTSNEVRMFPKLSDNVVCDDSTTSLITQPAFECRGKTLLDILNDASSTYNVGFYLKLRIRNLSSIEGLYLHAYSGQDKSSTVIFSEHYDSLVSSYFNRDLSNYHNFAYVFGENEGADRRWYYSYSPYMSDPQSELKGFFLRELFVDARDISSKIQNAQTGETEEMSEADYNKLLQNRGLSKLAEEQFYHTTGADINAVGSPFIYGTDYKLGDICGIRNHYAANKNDIYRSRIVEYILSHDANGLQVYPTFLSEIGG